MMTEIERIDETSWSDEQLQDELEQSQLVVDSIRVECSKALAKIDAVVAEGRPAPVESHDTEDLPTPSSPPGFGYWLKVGLALAIPLLLSLTGAGLLIQYLMLLLFQ
jgi:hypothetical protein